MRRSTISLPVGGVAAAAVILALAAWAGWLLLIQPRFDWGDEFHRLIAVSWSSGTRDDPVYGAYVFYEPRSDGRVDVRLRVSIDRSSPWFGRYHGDLTLDTLRDPREATAKWGTVRWSDQGLSIGSPAQAFLLPWRELEDHR